jgi:hypothetical protein
MGQIWPAQPTLAQLSWAGSQSNRGAGEPQRAAAPAGSDGWPAAWGVEVLTRAGRWCSGIILRLREDMGSPERAHDGDDSRAEEFGGDRSDRRSREAAVGPVNGEALGRFSRRWQWGWRWTGAACLRWRVGGGGAHRC